MLARRGGRTTQPAQGPGDPAFTEKLMRDCRRRLGVRCLFDNHNLDSDLPKPLAPLYAPLVPNAQLEQWAKMLEANQSP